jgi:hypothetical protein
VPTRIHRARECSRGRPRDGVERARFLRKSRKPSGRGIKSGRSETTDYVGLRIVAVPVTVAIPFRNRPRARAGARAQRQLLLPRISSFWQPAQFGPMTRLVDGAAEPRSNIAGRDPISIGDRGAVPTARDPRPPPAIPVPEPVDVDIAGARTRAPSLNPERGRPPCRDPHVETWKGWNRDLSQSAEGRAPDQKGSQNRSLE